MHKLAVRAIGVFIHGRHLPWSSTYSHNYLAPASTSYLQEQSECASVDAIHHGSSTYSHNYLAPASPFLGFDLGSDHVLRESRIDLEPSFLDGFGKAALQGRLECV
jgi:hypothetical protein